MPDNIYSSSRNAYEQNVCTYFLRLLLWFYVAEECCFKRDAILLVNIVWIAFSEFLSRRKTLFRSVEKIHFISAPI